MQHSEMVARATDMIKAGHGHRLDDENGDETNRWRLRLFNFGEQHNVRATYDGETVTEIELIPKPDYRHHCQEMCDNILSIGDGGEWEPGEGTFTLVDTETQTDSDELDVTVVITVSIAVVRRGDETV